MRILIISQYFWPENFRINDVCIGLKNRGHKVVVLTGKPNYPGGKYFDGYGWTKKPNEIWEEIPIYRSNLLIRGNGSGLRLFLNYLSFAVLSTLKLFSIKSKFDKVFIFAPSPITVGIPGIVASKRFKAKAVLWVHDLWPESIRIAGGIDNELIISLFNKMTKAIYNKMHKILIQSEAFRSYINFQIGDSEKIIYYPFYAESFYKVEKPEKEYMDELPLGFKLLFAGNIGEAQSFPTLLEAAKVLKSMNFPISWIVFGEGRMKDLVYKEIEDYGLQKHVFLMGALPAIEMPKYFSCVDGLIVSLKKSDIFSKTIPGKLQSYLACGKPIIGSLDGIGAIIINDAKCGFTANAESVEGLVKAIINLYNLSSDDRLTLGVNARKYYEKEFEREALLDKLENILNF